MMEKRHAWPEGHWNWPIGVTHKHGVRCGEMVWVGGQVDLSPDGVVCNPGDRAAQIRRAMAHFARVLGELDCDPEDLVTLLCFYGNDGSVDEAGFLASVGECLPPGAPPRRHRGARALARLRRVAGRDRGLRDAPRER